MRFSQRQGLRPLPSALAPDAMPDDLRNSLWNVLQLIVWDSDHFMWRSRSHVTRGEIVDFVAGIWFTFFKLPIDRIPFKPAEDPCGIAVVLLPSVVGRGLRLPRSSDSARSQNGDLVKALNLVLARELAAYRIVQGSSSL